MASVTVKLAAEPAPRSITFDGTRGGRSPTMSRKVTTHPWLLPLEDDDDADAESTDTVPVVASAFSACATWLGEAS